MGEHINIKQTTQYLRYMWDTSGGLFEARWLETKKLCQEALNIIESLGGHRFSKPDALGVRLPMSTLKELIDILEVLCEEI